MPALMPKSKKPATVPARFEPRFWDDADGRHTAVREIRRRYAALREDTGADTTQRDLLVQRAVFCAVRLESMEIEAAEGGTLDHGVYANLTNTLLGLLKALGLDRRPPAALDLKDYLARKATEVAR